MRNPLDDVFQDKLPKIVWVGLCTAILLVFMAACVVLFLQ